ncbi:MAG: hypothetical protein HXX11_06465 [Desulfuromonadales bacterium]|nr:hypothetical protein [Desulfuromonadales bacterium]
MRLIRMRTLCLLLMLLLPAVHTRAETASTQLEQAMSETLDQWREGRYEQLFDRLAHRGRTSREAFIKKMHESTTRPACCFQKMEHFKVLNEKRTQATVYVTIGLEGAPNVPQSCTREFKLTQEEGVWKMQLNDIYSLAGATGKKKRTHHR